MSIHGDAQQAPWIRKGSTRALLMGASALLIVSAFYLGRIGIVPRPKAARVLYYLDPMHPEYKSTKPGIAPDCGMELVPVYANATGLDDSQLPANTVHISDEQQKLIGLRTTKVERTSGSDELQMPGMVSQDEERVFAINSAVSGQILQTASDSLGSLVGKGQILAKFYSLEIIALEQNFLVATERMAAAPSPQAEQITDTSAARLSNAGMGKPQIDEIRKTRKLPDAVDITSPDNGVVVSRDVTTGQNFEKGAEFYRIADLSHVWIKAEANDGDTQYFRPGMAVSVHISGQDRTLHAKVSKALPQFDSVARTAQVRLDADNPSLLLRPNMLVTVTLPVLRPVGLTVPLDALVDSGTEQFAYVDEGGGNFHARAVRVGRHFSDRVEVLGGLEPGEKVVVSGSFLVDSARRIKRHGAPSPTTISQQTF